MELVYETSPGVMSTLWIDTATSVSHEHTATPTDYPIERGANNTDHVRDENDAVTYECTVTNTPIDVPETHMDGVTGSVRALEEIKGNTLQFSGEFDRVRAVDEELKRLKSTATLVSVVGMRVEYEGMIIRRYAPKQSPGTLKSLQFTLELRKIKIVDSEIVEVPDPEEERGRRDRSRGAVPAEEVAAPRRSFLREISGL